MSVQPWDTPGAGRLSSPRPGPACTCSFTLMRPDLMRWALVPITFPGDVMSSILRAPSTPLWELEQGQAGW